MNKYNKTKFEPRSTKHSDIQVEPRRVAARMEGVVKNASIEQKKKKPKH